MVRGYVCCRQTGDLVSALTRPNTKEVASTRTWAWPRISDEDGTYPELHFCISTSRLKLFQIIKSTIMANVIYTDAILR